MFKKHSLLMLFGLLILQLVLLVFLKFTAWPEMLLWPYLITKGWLPYVNIAIAHTPHLLISLASVYKIFGVGILELKIYTWALIIVTNLLVYFVANKFWGKKIAILSVIAYIPWQLFFDGNGLWFDLILAPISLITFYFLTKKQYFWTGIFWAFMFFNKQTSVWFLIPIIIGIVQSAKYKVQSIRNLILGTLTTIVIWTAGLWIWGVLPAFYNWAINFGIFVLPKASGQIQLPQLKSLLVSAFPFLIFVPFLLGKFKKNWNLLFWAITGSMGAFPRFEYFHFQPAIPYLAIASGLVFSTLTTLKGFWKYFLIIYLVGSVYLFAGYFMRNYREGTRFFETDVVDVAAYIKANTKAGDKIFIMNWWDSIYPLSNTLPAINPWVPQLSWYMELPGIQEKEVVDLQNSKPKMIILSPYSDSGLSAYIPQKVYSYVTQNYKISNKVDGVEIYIPK